MSWFYSDKKKEKKKLRWKIHNTVSSELGRGRHIAGGKRTIHMLTQSGIDNTGFKNNRLSNLHITGVL